MELTKREKYLTERVRRLCKNKEALAYVEEADGLIDDCKYLVYCTDEYEDIMDHCKGSSFPARSLKECAYFIDNEYIKCKD